MREMIIPEKEDCSQERKDCSQERTVSEREEELGHSISTREENSKQERRTHPTRKENLQERGEPTDKSPNKREENHSIPTQKRIQSATTHTHREIMYNKYKQQEAKQEKSTNGATKQAKNETIQIQQNKTRLDQRPTKRACH